MTAAVLIAIVALVVAGVALGLLLRARRLSPGDPMGGARYAELERRFSQVSQRLEVLEGDVDAQGSGRQFTDARPGSGAIGRSGSAISRIGLARFDAFDDTGGGQSFALALIDEEGDGVVLTTLHSRQSTRVYVKDIRGGVADAPLSVEEEHALRKAGLVP